MLFFYDIFYGEWVMEVSGSDYISPQPPATVVLGRKVHRVTMESAVNLVCSAWKEAQAFQVVTANAEMIHQSLEDPELAASMDNAELVTADGAGVVLASRVLGSPLPERVAGFDLAVACLKKAAEEGVPVYLLGARSEVLEEAGNNLLQRLPALQIAGSHHGYFNRDEEEGLLSEIQSKKPGLLLVAMGSPAQEKFIYRHKAKLPSCVAVGVGGSFDVLAGRAKRAPRWVQRAGLEWLYRLCRQPSRLGRAKALPLFLLKVLRQAFSTKT